MRCCNTDFYILSVRSPSELIVGRQPAQKTRLLRSRVGRMKCGSGAARRGCGISSASCLSRDYQSTLPVVYVEYIERLRIKKHVPVSSVRLRFTLVVRIVKHNMFQHNVTRFPSVSRFAPSSVCAFLTIVAQFARVHRRTRVTAAL